ncbi:AraC family transcriptional regulator [Burkholderia pseudomallei]|nr:AraC family transcriptional regulator [Burkholderia pseudomallei]CAJ9689091.1 AraC family transcriptional regulator [Burkholderia pseudomallei]CAK0092578.1 AraC family transcriptional regulator [Burkholderia pseudomallei]VCB50028.1 AraC family transcriptional regulator [Burkholderia pseudomallei]VCB72128.1 AraC family transcriptional regulator [Burkholderia pseudomallei]
MNETAIVCTSANRHGETFACPLTKNGPLNAAARRPRPPLEPDRCDERGKARVKRRGVASSRSGRVKQASFARASEGGSKASHARDAVTAAGTRTRRAAPNRIRHATAGCVCPSRRSNGRRRSAGATRLAGPPVTEDAPAPLMRRGNVTADGGHDAARYSMGGLAEPACDGERAPWDVVVVVVVVVARRPSPVARRAASGKRQAVRQDRAGSTVRDASVNTWNRSRRREPGSRWLHERSDARVELRHSGGDDTRIAASRSGRGRAKV